MVKFHNALLVDNIQMNVKLPTQTHSRAGTHSGLPAYIFTKIHISTAAETIMAEQMNAFQIAQSQFDKVAAMLNLDPGVREVLRMLVLTKRVS